MAALAHGRVCTALCRTSFAGVHAGLRSPIRCQCQCHAVAQGPACWPKCTLACVSALSIMQIELEIEAWIVPKWIVPNGGQPQSEDHNRQKLEELLKVNKRKKLIVHLDVKEHRNRCGCSFVLYCLSPLAFARPRSTAHPRFPRPRPDSTPPETSTDPSRTCDAFSPSDISSPRVAVDSVKINHFMAHQLRLAVPKDMIYNQQ